MGCNCDIGNGSVYSEAVRVVAGNAFTMRVNMRCMAAVGGKAVAEPFPVKDCTGLTVSLVGEDGGKTAADYRPFGSYALDISVDGSLAVGRYGLEITGTTKEGNTFRFYGKPDEVLEIVDASEAVCTDMESCTGGYYDISATLGMMQLPQQMLSDMEAVTAASKAQYEQLDKINIVAWEDAEEGGDDDE